MASQNINQSAPIKNIVMEQGASLVIPFKATRDGLPLDMTGYILRAQVRQSVGSTTVLLNMTQQNNMLIFTNAVLGEWKMVLTPSDTSAANGKIRFSKDEESLECVYEMEIESPSGQVFKPQKGLFTINRETCRA